MSNADWEKWAAKYLENNGFNDANRSQILCWGFAIGMLAALAGLIVSLPLYALLIFLRFPRNDSFHLNMAMVTGMIGLVWLVAECHIRIPKGSVGVPYRGSPDDPEWESTQTRLVAGAACFQRLTVRIRIEALRDPASAPATETTPQPSKAERLAEQLREKAQMEEVQFVAEKERRERMRKQLREAIEDHIKSKDEYIRLEIQRAGVTLPDDVLQRLLRARHDDRVYTILEDAGISVEPSVARVIGNAIAKCERDIEKDEESFS